MKAGLYEFGREDGSIQTRFVRIALIAESGVPFPLNAPKDTLLLARHALSNPGFWWRLIVSPPALPIEPDGSWMVSLPPAPGGLYEGGGA